MPFTTASLPQQSSLSGKPEEGLCLKPSSAKIGRGQRDLWEPAMAKPVLLDVTLTKAEAKAITRLVEAGVAQIVADPTPVTNETILRRAVEAAQRGAEKIKTALAAADAQTE